MAGYAKRIALIKTLKSGYSADGGPLKGLVRCEAYAGFLKIEASLINFAPLSEGCLRIGVSDGDSVVIFEGISRESETPFDLSRGFACLICFCRKGDVVPVACAVCGDMQGYLASVESAIRQSEAQPASDGRERAYDDEAIAEENYYELETDEGGGAVRENKGQKEKGGSYGGEEGYDNGFVARENEKDGGKDFSDRFNADKLNIKEAARTAQSGAGGEGSFRENNSFAAEYGRTKGADAENNSAEKSENTGEEGSGAERAQSASAPRGNDGSNGKNSGEDAKGGLAGGDFYDRMSGEIKKIFSVYPRATELEEVMEGSRWAKISYGGGRHYAFGVLYSGGQAGYICYGVPVEAGAPCPESLAGRAGYVPVRGGGYWVMYQDAATGVSIKIKNS